MMSQAKTQMVNKSFGLTGNTSNLEDNTWSSDGLGHFGSSSSMTNPIGLRSANANNSDNNNWSNSQASVATAKLNSNSSNGSNGGGDLWSNDIGHSNFNHNLDEMLAHEKHHSHLLKQTNKWNSDNTSFNNNSNHSNSNYDQNKQQQQMRSNNNNMLGISNQSDMLNSSAWNPFSSNPIMANSSSSSVTNGIGQPNRPSSSASTASSTNNSDNTNNNFNNNPSINNNNHHSNSNHSQSNFAQQNNKQWSTQQQQQNGWSSITDQNELTSDFKGTSNEWNQTNNTTSNCNSSSSTTTHSSSSSSQHGTHILRGSTATMNSPNSLNQLAPPPVAPVPPPPSSSLSTSSNSGSSSSQSASSIKSWAKIVSQQSSPSTNTASTSSGTPNQAQGSSQSTNSANISSTPPTSSSTSSCNSFTTTNNSNQNNFGFNNQNPNLSFNGSSGSTKSTNLKNSNAETIQHEWNINVNQTVPWEMENRQNSANNQNQFANNMLNSHSAASSSDSSSSPAAAVVTTTLQSSIQQQQQQQHNTMHQNIDSIMTNLIQSKPNPQQQQHQQSQKIDTGTDIWLNSNKPKPNSSWENGTNNQNNNILASSTSSNSQSSSSSPITTLANATNTQQTWSPNSSSNQANTQWNNSVPSNNSNNARWAQQEAFNTSSSNKQSEQHSQWNQSSSQNSSTWLNNNQQQPQQQQQKTQSSTSSSSSSSSRMIDAPMPLSETTNQMSRWNQQTPPPSSTPLTLSSSSSTTAAANSENTNPNLATLKVAIEPQGWDDPDFKIAKKNDDGTHIWGDPEHHRQVKVTKWMHVTRHMPNQTNTKTTSSTLSSEQDPNTQQNQMIQAMQQSQPSHHNNQQFNNSNNGSSSSSNTENQNPSQSQAPTQQQWSQQSAAGNNQSNTSQSKMLQQSMAPSSQWSNTPAAPLALGNNNESLINNASPVNLNMNEWSQDLVDTKSWSTFKDAKNNFDPSVGIIDTSKWLSNGSGPNNTTSNQSAQMPNAFNMQQQQNPVPNGNGSNVKMNMSGVSANSDWAVNQTMFNSNSNRDELMKQPLNRNNTNNANMSNLNSSNMMNSIGRMNNSNTNVQQQQLINNQMTAQQGLQHNKNNLNLNLIHNQGLQQSLMSSTNASNNLNNMIMNNSAMASSNDQSLNPSPQPQIQHQLIESFRLAVSSGLISADLLNTKLPQEVLTLLYQLFQTLTNYISANNKLNELNKRRGQMLATQFKSESELLTLEAQNYKNNLIALQAKINGAHQMLKQQASNQAQQSSGQKQSASPLTPGLVSTPPANLDGTTRSVERAAAAAGVQLTDLPILKDHSNQMNNLNAQQQRSKLLQLLNETNDPMGQTKGMQQAGLSRQASYQPNSSTAQQNIKLQQQFSQPGNFLSNSMNNQWPNFDSNTLMAMNGNNGQVDDRITPFIPGQLWAGSQSSFEDDPNCTPGSVSKPLLTETIDPENILNGLQRGSQWSNFSDNILNNSMAMSTMLGNNNNTTSNQRAANGIRNNAANNQSNSNNSQNWPSGFNLAQQMNSNNMNSGSIGEQLWGVGSRSTSRASNAPNINQLNTNRTGNFNSNNQSQMMNQQQQQQHQQQFFRNNNSNNSNWNQQVPQNNESRQVPATNNPNTSSSSSNGNNNNNFNSMPINSGNYILIRNVTANVDQSTLRALCSQHATGQLTYYRYIQQMTCVVVRYNTREEANNAQNKLNSVSLGNTVIFTQLLNENDLKFLFSMM